MSAGDMTLESVKQRLGLPPHARCVWPQCGCGEGDEEDASAGTGDPNLCIGPSDQRVLGRPLREDEPCPCPCHGGT